MTDGGASPAALVTAVLSALYIYPIKSCGGISLSRWTIDAFGPSYDRRWMVVDEEGTFVSQRNEARLALIRTAIDGDRLTLGSGAYGSISVPLEPGPARPERVRIWSDQVRAEPVGEEVDAWLGEVLGRRVHLVRMPDDTIRQVDRRYAELGDRAAFSDAFPFLLIGDASLEDLNGRLDAPLPMNRFRPNLVVAGSRPYEEDEWARITIGSIGFRVVKPCGRCVVTTTDQQTGERGVEPLRTLATYRRHGRAVIFGQNLLHDDTGDIAVGDAVVVRERRGP